MKNLMISALAALAAVVASGAAQGPQLQRPEFVYGFVGDTVYPEWREQARKDFLAPDTKKDLGAFANAIGPVIDNADTAFAEQLLDIAEKKWPRNAAQWADARVKLAFAKGDRKLAVRKLRERFALGCRPADTNWYRQAIGVLEKGIAGFDAAVKGTPAETNALLRLRALRKTSRGLFLLRDFQSCRLIQDEILQKSYKKFERRVCKAVYAADCPKSAAAFVQSARYADWKNYQTDFYAYGGGRGCSAKEDEAWHLVGTKEPAIKPEYPTGIQVLFDERGVEIFIRCDDPKAAEKALGKGNFGTLEIFFAPGGYDAPYRTIFFDGMPSVDDPHNCEWASAGMGYVRSADAYAKDCAVTKEGCVAHLSLPWLAQYGTLPFDGRDWTFGVSRWGDCGGQTIGGVVHELGCGMLIKFDVPASVKAKVQRAVCTAGYNAFCAYRAEPSGEFARFGDWDLGDPEFVEKALKPLMTELDEAGKALATAKDAELDRYVRDFLPRWAAITYEVQLKRTQWLDDRLFAD